MSGPYYIVKSVRSFNGTGYSGPACRSAGVEPGKAYDDLRSARRDAYLLSLSNPVGFRVVDGEGREILSRAVVLSKEEDMQNLFSDPACLERTDVQVMDSGRTEGARFEVWAGDEHLFDLEVAYRAVLAAALRGYNAGKRAGAELGREEMRDALRRLLGVASSEFVESLDDAVAERLREGGL